jgi:hypothetical protein
LKTHAPLQKSGRPTPFASMLMTRTPGLGGSMPAAGFTERSRVVYKGDPLVYFERLLR